MSTIVHSARGGVVGQNCVKFNCEFGDVLYKRVKKILFVFLHHCNTKVQKSSNFYRKLCLQCSRQLSTMYTEDGDEDAISKTLMHFHGRMNIFIAH